jgi:hypothetical protein
VVSRRIDMRSGVALIVAAGVAAGMVGWATGAAVSADPVDEPVETATQVETEPPTREEPLRITLAGDSVMAGLAPALEAALEQSGAAEVEFVLTPSILRDATVRFTWEKELDEFDPDVIVMFVGTWELGEVTNRIGTSVGPGDPAWRAAYDKDILDPWVDLITAEGAEVIWLGAPAVEVPEVDSLFDALNDAYRALPDRWPSVAYLDSTDALAGSADEGFVPIATTPDGERVRVRQIDGLHLCPDGAVLLADAVLARIEADHAVREAPGWAEGSWRNHTEYPPESCPPA